MLPAQIATQAAFQLLLLRVLRLSSGRSSSAFRLRLALLRHFRLGRSNRDFFDSDNLFLDDGDVGHGRALVTQKFDAARVRQIGDANHAMQLKTRNIDVEMARVEVIVHPQSIVHSMVEFIDSSVLAQLSTTDMCFPIQYAVTWPERVPNTLKPLDFAKLAKLEFEAPRLDDFPALNLARWADTDGFLNDAHDRYLWPWREAGR